MLALSSVMLSLIYFYNTLSLYNKNLTLLKPASIIVLAILTCRWIWKRGYLSDRKHKIFYIFLVLGLLFHSIGDTIIEYTNYILYPIPFFLFGHLLYSIVISKDLMVFNNHKVPAWKYIVIVFLLLKAVAFGYFFLSNVSGPLYVGILIYIIVLNILAIVSLLHPAGLKFLFIGVMLYVISDIIIAYDTLITKIALKTYLSWPLYYIAQLLIVYSLLNYHKSLQPHQPLQANLL